MTLHEAAQLANIVWQAVTTLWMISHSIRLHSVERRLTELEGDNDGD